MPVSYYTDTIIKKGRSIMEEEKVSLWKLFCATFVLSAFTFGGGYVIITLMKERFVDRYHWMEENEMLDMVSIAQSAPGPIAVNGSVITGYKLRGMAGVLAAVIGTALPPFLIITVISFFYDAFADSFVVSQLLEGMQAGVGAVIASVVYDMAAGIVKGRSLFSDLIMVAAFIATCFFGVSVVAIVIICIVLGVLRTLLLRKEAQ